MSVEAPGTVVGGDRDHAVERQGRRPLTGRPWRSVVFAPLGDGTTRRRGSDGLKLTAAVLSVVCCWLVTRTSAHAEAAIVRFLAPPPEGIRWLVNTVWWLGSVGAIAVLGLLALASRRRAMARDIALSGVGAWLASLLLQFLAGPNGGSPAAASLHGIDLVFPVARIAVTIAVATAVLPYLSRGLQRTVEVVVAVAALSTVVQGAGVPVSVLAGLAIGWGATAAVRLGFGSPLGLPSADEVAVLLAELDVDTSGVVPAPDQVWGVARYGGAGAGGRIDISVYGRDAHDAQLLAKLFRFLAYRDSGPTLALTRVQQVEHEAYLTLLAGRAGVRVPEIVVAGVAGPSRDAVLVTRPPPGAPLGVADSAAGTLADSAAGTLADSAAGTLADSAADQVVADLFVQVLALRRARIAHGSISPATVVATGSGVGGGTASGEGGTAGGTAGLVDFRRATATGGDDRLDRDVAAALATAGLAVGAERAVAAAARVLPDGVLASALPQLQGAALGPDLARSLRGRKTLLAELRTRGAGAAGVEVPKLAEPRRISWVNLLMVVGTVIGGWALIGVLVNVTHSWSTITGADWGWVVGTFVLAQLSYVALALETTGSVVDPLSLGPVVALEVASSFVQLAGGTMGGLATRVRFFQQQGYEATLAVSSGVLVSLASWIVKGALFLIALPLALGSLHFTKEPGGTDHGRLVWLIIVAVVALGVLLGAVLAVPRLRRLARDKLRPKASEVWSHLRLLAHHPRQLVKVFAGAITAQILIALALGAALHAFDQRLSLSVLIVVLTLAGMFGGVSPVPGGMGVVEAGMILGLTAAGVPQVDAVAATFVQRLFTSYLPPIWGWFLLLWLRRREYL